MAQYTSDATSIAKWFVVRANNEFVDDGGVAEGITNLKLQKLLYFAQAVSLSVNGKPLFDDAIVAWQFGPVVPVIYKLFKVFGNNPVSIDKKVEGLSVEVTALLEDVWSVYGKYSAHELVSITHNHLPWQKAYNASASDKTISIESVKEYYADYYHRT
ncbi:MAG: type II toxin-antitoxin system antitoxin SocA domain-containing protein [bacterium]